MIREDSSGERINTPRKGVGTVQRHSSEAVISGFVSIIRRVLAPRTPRGYLGTAARKASGEKCR